MAEPNWELWEGILRQLQTDMRDVRDRLERIERGQKDTKRQFTYMLGIASSAEITAEMAKERAEGFEGRFEDLMKKLDELEAKVDA